MDPETVRIFSAMWLTLGKGLEIDFIIPQNEPLHSANGGGI